VLDDVITRMFSTDEPEPHSFGWLPFEVGVSTGINVLLTKARGRFGGYES
jgi:hypothetical protein